MRNRFFYRLSSIPRSDPWLAIPTACSRFSGTCYPMRSSSPRMAAEFRSERSKSTLTWKLSFPTRPGNRTKAAAFCLRSLPPGRQQHDPRIRRPWPGTGDRASSRRASRGRGPCLQRRRGEGRRIHRSAADIGCCPIGTAQRGNPSSSERRRKYLRRDAFAGRLAHPVGG